MRGNLRPAFLATTCRGSLRKELTLNLNMTQNDQLSFPSPKPAPPIGKHGVERVFAGVYQLTKLEEIQGKKSTLNRDTCGCWAYFSGVSKKGIQKIPH